MIYNVQVRSRSFRIEFFTVVLLTLFTRAKWIYVLETLLEDCRPNGVSVVSVLVKQGCFAQLVFVILCQKFEMDVKKEQHVATQFCCKVGLLATETLGMVQKAYGDAALTRSNIFWRLVFERGESRWKTTNAVAAEEQLKEKLELYS